MIVQNQPNAVYQADPAIGSTSAKRVLESLQLFRDGQTGVLRRKGSDALDFGTGFHCRILQPDLLPALISEGPINPKTGKAFGPDSNAFAAWREANPGKIVLDEADVDAMDHMDERMPDQIRRILTEGGAAEVSVYQTIDGVPVKCRPDYLTMSMCTDLKTIDDIGNIGRAFRSYSYWFSQEWYKRILKAEFGHAFKFQFVFAEKKPPYRWKLVTMSEEACEEAAALVRGVILAIKAAGDSGIWADQSSITEEITWPDCGHFAGDES